jgi:hypothetical protein
VTELQQAILSEVAALDRRSHRRSSALRPPDPQEPKTEETQELPPAEMTLEYEALAAMVQYPDFAKRVLQELSTDAFTHPSYRSVFLAFQQLSDQGIAPDARNITTEDNVVASTLAALALYELPENVSFDKLFERMREEYENRILKPPSDPSADPEATLAFTERLRARSQQIKQRGGYEG